MTGILYLNKKIQNDKEEAYSHFVFKDLEAYSHFVFKGPFKPY